MARTLGAISADWPGSEGSITRVTGDCAEADWVSSTPPSSQEGGRSLLRKAASLNLLPVEWSCLVCTAVLFVEPQEGPSDCDIAADFGVGRIGRQLSPKVEIGFLSQSEAGKQKAGRAFPVFPGRIPSLRPNAGGWQGQPGRAHQPRARAHTRGQGSG